MVLARMGCPGIAESAGPGSRRATGGGRPPGPAEGWPFELGVDGGGGFFSAALMISSSSKLRAAQRTTHSTQSSFPSPRVCHTAFSSGVLPVMLIRVPPPFGPGGFFMILPNSIRLGGMLWPAYAK